MSDQEKETLRLMHRQSEAYKESRPTSPAALGKAMTGLPIDFQIQQRTNANEKENGPRSALGFIPLRMAKYERPSPERKETTR